MTFAGYSLQSCFYNKQNNIETDHNMLHRIRHVQNHLKFQLGHCTYAMKVQCDK